MELSVWDGFVEGEKESVSPVDDASTIISYDAADNL
jgi:hypothetical protein